MKARHVAELLRYFGLRPILQAGWHRFARACRLLNRKFPTVPWDELRLRDWLVRGTDVDLLKPLLKQARFFPVALPREYRQFLSAINVDAEAIASKADSIAQGRFTYYSKLPVQFDPQIDWHLNPFTGSRWPTDVHWCLVDYFDEQRGDIKDVWELSRFGWAFDLVRAHAATGDDRYAEVFWNLFESWLDNNPPNLGVNWVSGQECALRLLAWYFSLFAFVEVEATTAERIEKLLLAAAVHCHRIEGFISHAIRQKTNHALTEAAALYTTGTLFPFFGAASRWKTLGKRVLEREGFRQIYPDGSYVQHSMNYHRLMLQVYVWCFQLAHLNGDRFCEELKKRVTKAAAFVYQVQDDSTGRVPNYGANDGALMLPLNTCDYLDYRPAIQACWYLLKGEKLYARGAWDEDLLWLFGRKALEAPLAKETRVSCDFHEGGYYTLRTANSWAMVRCHSYRDRVGHVDPLHVDLWADGVNLLRDCGTYRYFVPGECEREEFFKSIRAHNTVIVDDCPPLQLVSRFVYLPWPKAKLEQFSVTNERIEWKGTSYAYARRPWHVLHSRLVRVDRATECWLIRDVLSGRGRHLFELLWHMPQGTKLLETASCGATLQLPRRRLLQVKGSTKIQMKLKDADCTDCWESLYYGHKQRIRVLSVTMECSPPATFETRVYGSQQQ